MIVAQAGEAATPAATELTFANRCTDAEVDGESQRETRNA